MKRWLGLGVDGLAVAAMVLWGRELVEGLLLPSGMNAFWLSVVYLLFWTAVFIIRKLQTPPATRPFSPLAERWLANNKVRGLLGLLFALVMMTVISFQLGYFNSYLNQGVLDLNEGEMATLLVFAPGAWLGMSLLYIIFLAFNVRETVAPQTGRYVWLTAVALLIANLMLILLAAQLHVFTSLLALPTLVAPLLRIILLTLLFAPPRLIYLNKQPSWVTAVSFTALLAVASW